MATCEHLGVSYEGSIADRTSKLKIGAETRIRLRKRSAGHELVAARVRETAHLRAHACTARRENESGAARAAGYVI
ncbi:hypothetical protein MTP99_019464 [Tenebrio molitor]|jgi:hypothetical protein|nr:hypothetical protein MTP99_019464 [Tenebrio molitor]